MGSVLSWLSIMALVQGCGYQTHHEEPGDDTVASASDFISADGGVAPSDDDDDPDLDPAPAPDETPPVLGHSDPAVAAAIAAWRERSETVGDLPSPDTTRCERRFATLEIVEAPTHDDFRRLCQRCDTTDPSPHCEALDRVNACAPWGDLRDDDGVIGALHALIVLDPTLAAAARTRDALVAHETIHHIGICTGFGPDSAHEQTFLWCGSNECVEGRAERAL